MTDTRRSSQTVFAGQPAWLVVGLAHASHAERPITVSNESEKRLESTLESHAREGRRGGHRGVVPDGPQLSGVVVAVDSAPDDLLGNGSLHRLQERKTMRASSENLDGGTQNKSEGRVDDPERQTRILSVSAAQRTAVLNEQLDGAVLAEVAVRGAARSRRHSRVGRVLERTRAAAWKSESLRGTTQWTRLTEVLDWRVRLVRVPKEDRDERSHQHCTFHDRRRWTVLSLKRADSEERQSQQE